MAAIMSKNLEDRLLSTLEELGEATPEEFADAFFDNPSPKQRRACKKALRTLALRDLVKREDGKVSIA